jgi:hypothetical protein
LLAFLVDRGLEANEAEFPWEHPHLGDLPEHNQRELDHARNFSVAIHGAPLLYNLMLGELTQNGDLVEEYRAALADWLLDLESILPRLHKWNNKEFWALVRGQNPRISVSTELFVTRWLDFALGRASVAIADNAAARALITDRELAMKRNLSRISNPRAREMWGGAAGARQLTYRWSPIVRNIVRDIKEGVESGARDA